MAMSTTAVSTNALMSNGREHIESATTPWTQTNVADLQIKVLYDDPDGGMSVSLGKLAAGAEVPIHEHTGIEFTYLLEGALRDEQGTATAGNLVWREPGTMHAAYA